MFNKQLQGTVDFFDLLYDKEIKFAREIEALKINEAALDSKLYVDEKYMKKTRSYLHRQQGIDWILLKEKH